MCIDRRITVRKGVHMLKGDNARPAPLAGIGYEFSSGSEPVPAVDRRVRMGGEIEEILPGSDFGIIRNVFHLGEGGMDIGDTMDPAERQNRQLGLNLRACPIRLATAGDAGGSDRMQPYQLFQPADGIAGMCGGMIHIDGNRLGLVVCGILAIQ